MRRFIYDATYTDLLWARIDDFVYQHAVYQLKSKLTLVKRMSCLVLCDNEIDPHNYWNNLNDNYDLD